MVVLWVSTYPFIRMTIDAFQAPQLLSAPAMVNGSNCVGKTSGAEQGPKGNWTFDFSGIWLVANKRNYKLFLTNLTHWMSTSQMFPIQALSHVNKRVDMANTMSYEKALSALQTLLGLASLFFSNCKGSIWRSRDISTHYYIRSVLST